MSRYSIRASSASMDSPCTTPPAGVRLIRRSSAPVSGGTSNSSEMPFRPSTSQSRIRRPLVASAQARRAGDRGLAGAALPADDVQGVSRAHEMPETAMPAWVLYRRLMAMRLAVSASTWPALRSRPA